MNGFWALVHEENGAFGISFPDIPGCISADETLEGVLSSGREALSAHIAWMKAEGDVIPTPRPYAALADDAYTAELSEGASWHLLSPRTVQAPRIRVNIMIDPGLLRETDEAAEAAGMTRSGLIEAALRDRLVRDEASSAVDQLPVFKPDVVRAIHLMDHLRGRVQGGEMLQAAQDVAGHFPVLMVPVESTSALAAEVLGKKKRRIKSRSTPET